MVKYWKKMGLVSPQDLQSAITEQQYLRSRPVGEIISAKTKLPQAIIDSTIEQMRRQTDTIITSRTRKPVRVGDILMEAGIVTQEQIDDALATHQTGKKKRIGEILIDHRLINEDQLLSALASKFHMPFMDLSDIEPTHEALTCLSTELVKRMKVFPIEIVDNQLVVATCEPADVSIDDTLRFHTSLHIKLVVATAAHITAAIERHYTSSQPTDS